MASIAAMRRPKKIVAALMFAAAAAGILGCGNSDPEPSIPIEDAEGLAALIDEIRANVDNGSCLVALSRTDDLIAEINALPDDVNQEVQNALAEGTNNLKDLIEDPDQCDQPEETTTEETTTEKTETERTETEPTETQPTQTQETPTVTQTTPQPGGGSGGVGPGGIGNP